MSLLTTSHTSDGLDENEPHVRHKSVKPHTKLHGLTAPTVAGGAVNFRCQEAVTRPPVVEEVGEGISKGDDGFPRPVKAQQLQEGGPSRT